MEKQACKRTAFIGISNLGLICFHKSERGKQSSRAADQRVREDPVIIATAQAKKQIVKATIKPKVMARLPVAW